MTVIFYLGLAFILGIVLAADNSPMPTKSVKITLHPQANNDPNVCTIPCGKTGIGCAECTISIFSCPSKELTAVCSRHFNDSSIGISKLNLENNSLTDFRSFHGVYPSVLVLKLGKNNLTNITKADLAKFPNLRYLDLSNNNQQSLTLPEDLFNALPDLEELYIHTMQIQTLPANIFRQNKKLRYLNLSNNRFDRFPREIFMPIWERMTRLQIDENPITEITADDFAYLRNLEFLSMERLDIITIGAQTFSQLAELREISLAHNSKLAQIDEDAFGMFSQKPGEMALLLEKVSVQSCGLRSLGKNTFKLGNMKEIGLMGNPWVCDCKISWMVDPETLKGILGKEKFKEELQRTKCQNVPHQGIDIYAIPSNHFTCSTFPSTDEKQEMQTANAFPNGLGGAASVVAVTSLLCAISVIIAVFIIGRRKAARRRAANHNRIRQQNPVLASGSQYQAISNQGNVHTHDEKFVEKNEKSSH